MRGDSHAWTEEAEREAIRGRGRNTLPRTERKRERETNREAEREIKTVSNRQKDKHFVKDY